jgi:hypothetical protein
MNRNPLAPSLCTRPNTNGPCHALLRRPSLELGTSCSHTRRHRPPPLGCWRRDRRRRLRSCPRLSARLQPMARLYPSRSLVQLALMRLVPLVRLVSPPLPQLQARRARPHPRSHRASAPSSRLRSRRSPSPVHPARRMHSVEARGRSVLRTCNGTTRTRTLCSYTPTSLTCHTCHTLRLHVLSGL